MEGKEEAQFVEVGMGDMECVVEDRKPVFYVGKLVEFWAGPVMHAYRTDSGGPAYVKEIHGSGWYVIKMVGSFVGRLGEEQTSVLETIVQSRYL
jgi:hypothetical protein